MLKRYSDSNLVWNTETGEWLKEKPEKEAPVKEVSIQAEVKHFADYLKDLEEEPEGRLFTSNFSSFDEQIEGIETGEVVVVSGHTKNGKTLFAESWIRSMMEKSPLCKALFFSFEVKTKKLLLKYTDNLNLPLYVPSTLKTMDFDWLFNHCKDAKENHGCSIVLIDHLHFMIDMNTKQNMSLNIGGFMRRLKQDIAIGLDMAVILIAHQGQAQKGNEASVNSIRDSSFVAQEADSIIMVNRRKNLDEVELHDIESKYGIFKRQKVEQRDEAFDDDEYSMKLAVVSIERARRSGVFEYKKLFKKVGDFLEEI